MSTLVRLIRRAYRDGYSYPPCNTDSAVLLKRLVTGPPGTDRHALAKMIQWSSNTVLVEHSSFFPQEDEDAGMTDPMHHGVYLHVKRTAEREGGNVVPADEESNFYSRLRQVTSQCLSSSL